MLETQKLSAVYPHAKIPGRSSLDAFETVPALNDALTRAVASVGIQPVLSQIVVLIATRDWDQSKTVRLGRMCGSDVIHEHGPLPLDTVTAVVSRELKWLEHLQCDPARLDEVRQLLVAAWESE